MKNGMKGSKSWISKRSTLAEEHLTSTSQLPCGHTKILVPSHEAENGPDQGQDRGRFLNEGLEAYQVDAGQDLEAVIDRLVDNPLENGTEISPMLNP